jgi:tripartite motif-containing protein 71
MNLRASILIFVLVGIMTLVSIFTSNNNANAALKDPTGVAVDPFGSVFTSEAGKNIIQKFTNTGTFIRQWESEGKQPATDSSGNVYVVSNNQIIKYTNDGKFIRQWGEIVGGIAVDKSNGNIFVLATNLSGNDDRIEKYSNTGKFIRKWGSTGEEKGQFDNPMDIAVDSKGYVFVADTGMDRIQKFSNTGKFIREWGHERRNITSLSPSGVPMGTGAPLR